MSHRERRRPTWPELPEAVRGAVERALGSAVVRADGRDGGWSPGSADVVTTADGRRAFVKTADAGVNAQSVAIHRREAAVLRLLDGRSAPRLRHVVDEPPWIAVVVEAIDGRHPDPALRGRHPGGAGRRRRAARRRPRLGPPPGRGRARGRRPRLASAPP